MTSLVPEITASFIYRFKTTPKLLIYKIIPNTPPQVSLTLSFSNTFSLTSRSTTDPSSDLRLLHRLATHLLTKATQHSNKQAAASRYSLAITRLLQAHPNPSLAPHPPKHQATSSNPSITSTPPSGGTCDVEEGGFAGLSCSFAAASLALNARRNTNASSLLPYAESWAAQLWAPGGAPAAVPQGPPLYGLYNMYSNNLDSLQVGANWNFIRSVGTS